MPKPDPLRIISSMNSKVKNSPLKRNEGQLPIQKCKIAQNRSLALVGQANTATHYSTRRSVDSKILLVTYFEKT